MLLSQCPKYWMEAQIGSVDWNSTTVLSAAALNTLWKLKYISESVCSSKIASGQSLNSISVLAEWHSSDRVRRGAKRLPQLENKELHSTVSFAENQLTMMGRHEKNIMGSDVRVKLGSVLHGAYIESLPSTDALVHGKDAMVALKASQHIGSKYCYRSVDFRTINNN